MVRQAKKRNPPKRVQMTAGGEEVRDSSAVPGQKCSAQTALFCPVLPLCQCRLCSSSSAFLFVCFHGLPQTGGRVCPLAQVFRLHAGYPAHSRAEDIT
jgi:hypothetical protein